MRTPTDDENDTYNKLLEGIESADTESPRWDEVRDALKMIWSLAGGVITETATERRDRLGREVRAAEDSKKALALDAMRAAIGDSMKAWTPWHARAIVIVHSATGLEVAKWNPSTGEICVGSKVGPRCYDAASAVTFIKSVMPF